MKHWPRWRFPVRDRRLQVSLGGRWFLLFTLLLGIVAINSGNNVIYLLESLLLSALLVSGVLSETTVKKLQLHRRLSQAVAGEETGDILWLENTAWFPLYCVELGEWREGNFFPLAFALIVPARARVRLVSAQILPRRGRHEWQGLAVATSFPFGFARKIRLVPESASRIVWPASSRGENQLHARGDWDWESGELEEIEPGQDVSRVHWPASQRAGKFLARPRRPLPSAEEVNLNIDEVGSREEKIRHAAGGLQAGGRVLVLQMEGARRRVEGSERALDTLALLPEDLA